MESDSLQVLCHMHLILGFERQRQAHICEFKASQSRPHSETIYFFLNLILLEWVEILKALLPS